MVSEIELSMSPLELGLTLTTTAQEIILGAMTAPCPPRPGDLAGVYGQEEQTGPSRRKTAHNAAVRARGAGSAASVFSSGQSIHLTQTGIFSFPLLISALLGVTM